MIIGRRAKELQKNNGVEFGLQTRIQHGYFGYIPLHRSWSDAATKISSVVLFFGNNVLPSDVAR
jgi:hypothetical protein